MSTPRIPPGGFYTNPDFDFEARIVLGQAGTGIGDVGMALAVLDKIPDGDWQAWFDQWCAAAAQLADQGHAAVKAGHLATARWALLTAATFYTKALVAVVSLADQSVQMPTFREHRACWEAYIDASEDAFVRVPVPYEGTTMPGYLLRPDASGAARPTFVMTNGSDEGLTSLLSSGGAEALSRGWNVFCYDGPGQQSMLFERGIPFRYDWEAVLTPVVDTLVQRPDVDASRLTGYGVSQGGYWIIRAVAFEKRFLAAVADPGAVDVSAGWTAHLPPQLLQLLNTGQKDAFNKAMGSLASNPQAARTMAFRGKPYGVTDPYDLFKEVEKYQVRDVAAQVTTPMLILDPQDEQFYPGQAQQVYDLLPGEKTIMEFTRANGANHHCQPLDRHLTATLMLDWLSDHVPASAPSQESQVQS